MDITIEINTDNAAFDAGATGKELSLILRNMADQIEDWPGANSFSLGIKDSNKEKVGTFSAIES